MSSNGYVIQWADNHRIILPKLYEFYLNQQFVDIVIKCGGGALKAHSLILASSSKYFEKRLREDVNVLELPSIEPDVMSKIIEFMYLGATVVEDSELQAVLAAARFLEVSGLQNVTQENVLETDNARVIINSENDLRSLLLSHEVNGLIDETDFNQTNQISQSTRFAMNLAMKASRKAVENMRKCGLMDDTPRCTNNTSMNLDVARSVNEDEIAAKFLVKELKQTTDVMPLQNSVSVPSLDNLDPGLWNDVNTNREDLFLLLEEENNQYMFQDVDACVLSNNPDAHFNPANPPLHENQPCGTVDWDGESTQEATEIGSDAESPDSE